MNYDSHFLVSPHSPGAGGLVLFWKKKLDLEILSFCQQFLDTRITAKGKTFYATFLYGEPERVNRIQVWNQLKAIGITRVEPWFITGDFNDIIDSSEKSGGPPRSEGSFTDL